MIEIRNQEDKVIILTKEMKAELQAFAEHLEKQHREWWEKKQSKRADSIKESTPNRK